VLNQLSAIILMKQKMKIDVPVVHPVHSVSKQASKQVAKRE